MDIGVERATIVKYRAVKYRVVKYRAVNAEPSMNVSNFFSKSADGKGAKIQKS